MNVTGILKLVKETQVVSEKFKKREFVVETNEQYPQTIQLELQGNYCDIIDAYKIGQEISVDINLRGRIWKSPQGEEKYFNTLVAWKIQPSNAPVGVNANNTNTPQEVYGKQLPSEDESDLGNLPF